MITYAKGCGGVITSYSIHYTKLYDVKPLLFGNLISAGVYLYIRYLIKNDKLVLTTNISLIEITISVSFSYNFV